jgi:rhamnosyltransferase subunit B
LLAMVNQELARSGRAAIGALPQLFGANRDIVTGFTQLDVYQPWRASRLFSPSVDIDSEFDLPSPLNRNEIFVYYYQAVGPTSLLWDALEMTKLPVRIYVPRLDQQEISALEKRNFVVERHPIAWSEIALRSRIVLSHGGSGFVSNALAHGMPQVIAYYDVEKLLIARAVGELGLGLHVHALRIDPLSLSEAIVDLYYDQALAKRAEDASHNFRNQLGNSALAGSLVASDELLDRG